MNTVGSRRVDTAVLKVGDRQYQLPLVEGTEHEHAVDISDLRDTTGLITLDDGYRNTGSVESAITFIDGEKGVLHYRGIPIQQLAAHSSFPETALLLIDGELPTAEHLARFRGLLTEHEMIHEGMRHSFEGFPSTGHPMAILSAMINTMSCYNVDVLKMEDESTFENAAARLLSKVRTVAAAAYKTSIGHPIMYPDPSLSYCDNFLHMMFSLPTHRYQPDPEEVHALSLFLILHADHEQNCSTSTVRMVGNTQVVLEASQYHQGRLDWYAFDNVLRPTPLATDAAGPVPMPPPPRPISFLPTPAVFKGVPNPRFWEMEDRQIDFGKLNAKTTDHLLLAFAEFGLVYGNDWFVIPYKLAVNTLCEVQGLVITDVFGDRTLIRAADEGADNEWQTWSMFSLSNKDHMGQYNRLFFLPPTLTNSLESEPIEAVNLVRDEMANMVWGVEDVIPDATGQGISGHEAADKTGVLPPPIAASPAAIRYLLGTTVPENWIPFLPVHKPGSVQDIQFQRASMPKLGSPPKDVVKAKGVFLTEQPSPYFIHEEEIPHSGTILRRSWQRARWFDGTTYLWIGRYRETGRGEGNSKLRFDAIEPVKTA